MVLPKKIKIGTSYFSVIRDKDKFKEAESNSGAPDSLGLTEPKMLEIFIMPRLALGMEQDVLAHEIGHAIYYVYNIATFIDSVASSEREEMIVSQASMGWLQVIRDNPKLMEYLDQKD